MHMNSGSRRETILAFGGICGLAALFLFVVYLPGRRDTGQIHGSIVGAEQMLREIPVRVAELEYLNTKIDRLQAYLRKSSASVPREADLHAIIGQVAALAETNNLRVTRLEPLSPITSESYETLPFHLTLSGSYPGVVRFLNGLSTQSRLFVVDDFSLDKAPQMPGASTEVDMRFSTYVRRIETAELDDFDAS
jgi:Tfp pilus assembly protein PilO